MKVGAGASIHPSVVFVPYEDKKTIIGKRVRIASGSAIYGGVEIGNDSVIGHNTVVRQNTRIGVHSVIAHLCVLEGNLTVGEHTLITPQNHLGQKTKVGNYVFMAPMCVATNDPKMIYYRDGYSQGGEHWKLLGGPTIEDGARIAVGVMFFPKIRIGRQAVIGAGSVVTKDVPDYAVVYGVPAEVRDNIQPEKDVIHRCAKDHS